VAGRGPLERDFDIMVRKRALRGAVTLALALSLFAAPVASAAGAPERALTGAWTAIESWIQNVLAGWLGPEPVESIYAADACPPGNPACPGSTEGGGGGASTTDGGAVTDPDG
jgi:hypothetical protein